jgi:hypothetical protein
MKPEEVKKVVEAEKGNDRWSKGIPHHPKSEELMAFLEAVDFHAYGDYFSWSVGGDGDNGETLMYQMDAFFEAKDKGDQ